MKTNKMISVALAAYNGEKYIAEQLDSILPQLGESDEVVISLDPSADGTRDIVTQYGDDRIRLIDGKGKGVIKNFENAITNCRGDYIFLCDQDDVWMPDKVSSVMAEFEQTDALLVMHDAYITDGDLNITEESFFKQHGTSAGFMKNFVRNSFIGCCMAFSSALIKVIIPFPDSLPMHDQWIGLRALRKGQVALLQKPLIKYRRHGGNVSADTHSSLFQMIKWRWQLFCALMKK